MELQLKQRVVGAGVLVAIGVIFIPVFLDHTVEEKPDTFALDRPAQSDLSFSSRVVPIDAATMTRIERAMDASPDELAVSMEATATSVPPLADAGQVVDHRHPNEPITSAMLVVAEDIVVPRTGVTAWIVQLGSFGSEENAAALTGRLKEKNFTAFVEPFGEGATLAYRVRVGPELTKEDAERSRTQLAQDIAIDGIVMRYP
jgi:DedD protein